MPALAVADALRAEGADVCFLGARDRVEADARARRRATRSSCSTSAASTAATRSGPRRALGLAAARGPAARAASCAARGADAVLGGGGYVGGPGGPRRVRAAAAAGPDRGRSPPRARQPAPRPPGAPGLPRLPDRRARGRALRGHRPPGPGGDRGRGPRGRARSGSGSTATTAACSSSAAARAPGRSTARALEAFAATRPARRDFHVLHIAGARDYPSRPRARSRRRWAERYTLVEYEPGLGDALAACDLVLARAGGSIFEIAAAGRPAILVPYPHAAATTSAPTPSWMADGGRRDRDRRRPRSSPGGCWRSAARAARRPAAPGRDGARPRGALARPDAAERVAEHLLAAIGGT